MALEAILSKVKAVLSKKPKLPTKAAALHQFFNSFGVSAYTATSVPEDVVFPWMTYELITSAWEDGPVGLTVNLWYRTTSEAVPNAKAQEISEAIGRGGISVPCDGGYIRILRGQPWCQSLRDETDPVIKRRYMNITAIYYTEN